MKTVYLVLSLFLVLNGNAQLAEETKVVIVACKSGDLFIDGIKVATVEADDARQEKIVYGEHYLQLKSGTEKFSLTIKVDQNTKDIIKIGCITAATSTLPKAVTLVEKELYLTGALVNNSEEQNMVGLDIGDEILLSCDVVNKKGTANVSIKNFETGSEIYKKGGFATIESDRIRIPSKGIYIIKFSTAALLGKNVKFKIERIPGSNSKPNFSTIVKKIYDTSFVEILNTNTRVYSITNNRPNKTTIKINLPSNTTYWAYWLGVDQEAAESMKNFATQLSKAGPLLSTNPLVLFGMKLIPSLPMVSATSTISYKFMDSRNAQAFVNGQQYSYFTFKHANNISTDYALINTVAPDLVLSFENSSLGTGRDVDVKVVAFTVKPKFILEE